MFVFVIPQLMGSLLFFLVSLLDQHFTNYVQTLPWFFFSLDHFRLKLDSLDYSLLISEFLELFNQYIHPQFNFPPLPSLTIFLRRIFAHFPTYPHRLNDFTGNFTDMIEQAGEKSWLQFLSHLYVLCYIKVFESREIEMLLPNIIDSFLIDLD